MLVVHAALHHRHRALGPLDPFERVLAVDSLDLLPLPRVSEKPHLAIALPIAYVDAAISFVDLRKCSYSEGWWSSKFLLCITLA